MKYEALFWKDFKTQSKQICLMTDGLGQLCS